MTFRFSIPTPSGERTFQVAPGTTLLFVGANGGGKTRLAVKIEQMLGEKAHRISAHRALLLNADVAKVSERAAIKGLRTGGGEIGNRIHNRWRNTPAVGLLSDYDFLLQALFAEQANTAVRVHKDIRAGVRQDAQPTNFERLNEIWDRILPHRKLDITGDNIEVLSPADIDKYKADEMSDGERAVFYLIGQTLSAANDSLIIFDEPELHIHRAIMSRLWDELEAARPDCGMVLISHDLEFVASRKGQKFVVTNYTPSAGWTIEQVPEDTGFTEEITTLILGSRKPILFIEGQGTSLDKAIYRACYPDWTIIPRGSCEEVIHSVVTMRANPGLTRVTCSGIVDADDYTDEEKLTFEEKGIEILPVSEIENIFLLPVVAEAIARAEGFRGAELDALIKSINDELFDRIKKPECLNPIILRYCRRRIDRALKIINLSAADTQDDIKQAYIDQTGSVDIDSLRSYCTRKYH